MATDSYGPAGSYCWIMVSRDWQSEAEYGMSYFWRALQYLIIWIAIIYNIVIYHKVRRSVSRDFKEAGIRDNQVLRTLRFYPLILIITWLPISILRIVGFFITEDHPSAIGTILIFFQINGLLNALAYGLNQAVRDSIRATLCGTKATRGDHLAVGQGQPAQLHDGSSSDKKNKIGPPTSDHDIEMANKGSSLPPINGTNKILDALNESPGK